MKLHQDKKLFTDAIRITAQQLNIPEIYIEKDYWVTYALHLIFNSSVKEEAIFKGGTALSKCYGLIERFSEDIDLVLLRKEEDTKNQLKNKLKELTNVVTEPFVEEDLEGITNKMGMIRKVAYNYPKSFSGQFGQVRDRIIIEASWLGYHEPFSKKTISSYIYDMMVVTKQTKIAEQFGLLPFEVLVLDVHRTLCEKIMSLVRFSYSENPIEDLNNKIRHIYDIHQLLKNDDIQKYFYSENFDEMLLNIANEDVESFKNNNEYLKRHPKDALLFSEPKETWNKLKKTYQNSFKNLVFGELPEGKNILETIEEVAKRLTKINWNINPN
jgi:hypothetical protein